MTELRQPQEIVDCRKYICEVLKKPGLNEIQLVLLSGMLNALAWVCKEPQGSTIVRLLNGESIQPGKDPSKGLDTLKSIVKKVSP